MPLGDLSDAELFDALARERAAGRDAGAELGELLRRWRAPAASVVGKVQRTFQRPSRDDAEDVLQESVARLLDKGLVQFHGRAAEGGAAAPLAFFLRIVKHAAIDRCRRQREQLASAGEEREEEPHQLERGVAAARRQEERAEAGQLYRAAFVRLQREHPQEAAAWELYRHQEVEDHGECARRLGISVASSYKRVSRAQAWLRAYVLELSDG